MVLRYTRGHIVYSEEAYSGFRENGEVPEVTNASMIVWSEPVHLEEQEYRLGVEKVPMLLENVFRSVASRLGLWIDRINGSQGFIALGKLIPPV